MSRKRTYQNRPLTCAYCGNTFEGRKGAQYCSAACKQQSHRDRKNPETVHMHSQYEKAYYTRATHEREFSCAHCGKMQRRDANSTNAMYCSDACKQASYRERRNARKVTPTEHAE